MRARVSCSIPPKIEVFVGCLAVWHEAVGQSISSGRVYRAEEVVSGGRYGFDGLNSYTGLYMFRGYVVIGRE